MKDLYCGRKLGESTVLFGSTLANIIKNTIETGNATPIKCNLTNLRSIIKWIPSKYNDYSKEEVVKDIMARKSFNDNLIWRYDCGSKAEGAWNGGRTFTLVCHPTATYLICEYSSNDVKIYKLEG